MRRCLDSVNTHMCLQVAFGGEGARTYTALEWTLAGVRAMVVVVVMLHE